MFGRGHSLKECLLSPSCRMDGKNPLTTAKPLRNLGQFIVNVKCRSKVLEMNSSALAALENKVNAPSHFRLLRNREALDASCDREKICLEQRSKIRIDPSAPAHRDLDLV